MKEDPRKITVPRGNFDDRDSSDEKEIFARGKELGRIAVEGLGTYVFHMIGDTDIEKGLDLLMTDVDQKTVSIIEAIGSKEEGYKFKNRVQELTGSWPIHAQDITKIVDEYTIELQGFGLFKQI